MGDMGTGSETDTASGKSTRVRRNYDWAVTTPSTAVIEAIAALEDVDPVALAAAEGMPLSEYINTEAFDTLVADQRAEGVRMTFTFDSYTVRIAGSELIVESTDPAPTGNG